MNEGVIARAIRRSATVLQGSCRSLRRSIAARLLPDAKSLTFGATIRIAYLQHPSCLSQTVNDLPFLWTIRDRR
jgi:hypothetical protein